MSARCQPKLAFVEWAEHLARSFGKAEVCVTVINRAWLDRADPAAEVFTAHSVVSLIQNCVRRDHDFGLFFDTGNGFYVYRCLLTSLSDCILDLAQGLHRQTCRQVTFILNKIAGLLHLIHVLIEVLIRSHFE